MPADHMHDTDTTTVPFGTIALRYRADPCKSRLQTVEQHVLVKGPSTSRGSYSPGIPRSPQMTPA